MATIATRTYPLFINGDWKESRSPKFVENRNPARTDEVLGLVPLASEDEVDESIEAAAGAFPGLAQNARASTRRYCGARGADHDPA